MLNHAVLIQDLVEHREDIEALRMEHLQWFMATYYAPENATLVVSGSFDEAATRAAIERWFGPIRRVGEAAPEIPSPEIVRLPDERRIVVEAPMRHDQLRVAWPTPRFGADSARTNAGSSSSFAISRRYATMSLISVRSNIDCPPEIS